MRFATDAYFHIGLSHLNSGKPCQDYALADVYGDGAFAIVSDGCSTGGHTDVGARILTLSTASAIREHHAKRHIMERITAFEISVRQKVVMAESRKILGLTQKDMLATCIYQYMTQQGGFIDIQGDGIRAYKKQNGYISMHRYEWADNRPFYPAYGEDDFAEFVEDHGGDVHEARLTCISLEYSDGNFSQPVTETFTLGEGIRGITIRLSKEELQELEFSAIFSDGATQIEGLEWNEAVVQLLAFKTAEGEFAKRRMIRVIKDAQRNGRGPFDDIAYGVVRFISSQGGN